MKCTDQHICPLIPSGTRLDLPPESGEGYCGRDLEDSENYIGCHLPPADFPIIGAMIAGKTEHKAHRHATTGEIVHELRWVEEA